MYEWSRQGEAGSAWKLLLELRGYPTFSVGDPLSLAAVAPTLPPRVACYGFPTVQLLELEREAKPMILETSRFPITGLDVSPDGKSVAWILEGSVHVRAVQGETATAVTKLPPFQFAATAALFSRFDSDKLWIASPTMLRRWSLLRGELEWEQLLTVRHLALSNFEDVAAVEDGSGGLFVIDSHGARIAAGVQPSPLEALAFHPSERVLIVVDQRGDAVLWDTALELEVARLPLGIVASHVGFDAQGASIWLASDEGPGWIDVDPVSLKRATLERAGAKLFEADPRAWIRLPSGQGVGP